MNSSDMSSHFRELDGQGYTVLKDLLTPPQVTEAVATLKVIYEREKAVAEVHEPFTKRSFNMTARGEIFRQLLQLPKLVACMEYMLGGDYILSDMGARSPMPGLKPQPLHRDATKFLPNPPYNVHAVLPLGVQSMFALTEFTRDNGATRFVPGSHSKEIDIKSIRPEDEYRFTCSPGTVLVYDNRLIHGGGANTSNQVRYSLQGFHVRSYVKPFCDHTRSIPPEVVKAASP